MAQPATSPPASAGQDGPLVLVLGMHRSGTSLCASMLHGCGIPMIGDDQLLATEGNRKGHFERWDVVRAHRQVLELFGQRYDSLSALPPLWWRDDRLAGVVAELRAVIAANRGRGPWGLKDPRTMRLFRLWRTLLDESGLAFRLVLCLRRPGDVARSLAARDAMPLAAGLALWLRHLADFLTAHADLPWLVVEYDDWFVDPDRVLVGLLDGLALGPVPDAPARRALIEGTVSPALRRASRPDEDPPALAALYAAIKATCQTRPEARQAKRRLAAGLRRACLTVFGDGEGAARPPEG